MRRIEFVLPNRIIFGRGCASDFVEQAACLSLKRIFLVSSPPILQHVHPIEDSLRNAGAEVLVYDRVSSEPTIEMLDDALAAAREFVPDGVVGVGGGSAMDLAKLVAALHDSQQHVRDAFGIGQLASRSTFLACLPTTSGTGSEVSPNAILLDSSEQLKKGVVSPHLMPDAAYVDPLLTASVPAEVTAATGADALVHCIEAYANRFAHPIVDVYVLEGVKLIGANLARVVKDGKDMEARERMSLGSLYGGLGLGPVGTGAVHALSYPLGGEFHVPHGIANAALLPAVVEFNLTAAPERYADIALALGAEEDTDAMVTAKRGLEILRQLYAECGIPSRLSDLGVPEEAIPRMVESAMKVTRLLRNNPREVTPQDAETIYRASF